MRKEFREPELKRIELRLEERIALTTGYVSWGFTTTSAPGTDPAQGCREFYTGTKVRVGNDIVTDITAYLSQNSYSDDAFQETLKISANCSNDQLASEVAEKAAKAPY